MNPVLIPIVGIRGSALAQFPFKAGTEYGDDTDYVFAGPCVCGTWGLIGTYRDDYCLECT